MTFFSRRDSHPMHRKDGISSSNRKSGQFWDDPSNRLQQETAPRHLPSGLDIGAAIAHTGFGQDQFRRSRVGLHLLAQLSDEYP